jgi:16S rRNA (cytosine967-C5)-methyltransferase
VPAPARRAALEVLARASLVGGTLADVLADVLAAPKAQSLDPRDRALLHELVLGTLRRRGWLDHALSRLTDRPLGRVAPALLDVLRVGAYQLLFTRVPPHAVLSESVDLARAVQPRAAGFVNAVLRRLQREGPPPEPDPQTHPLDWLTTVGSLPAWLAARWVERLGSETATARARALLEPAPTHFRLNPRRVDAAARVAGAGIETLPTAVPGALEARGAPLAALADEGLLYVQDMGSQLVARLAAGSGLVLDACAAPGGKALLLADLGSRDAQVVAAEASPRRLRTLARLRARWGAGNVSIVGADARRPPFRGPFDAVLLDAPCSGLGTLARRPDIRWRVRPRDVQRHAARQREMLDALAPLVRPEGILVYSTCSVEDEETVGVVSPFLESHPEFSPEALPDWAEPFRDGPFVRMAPERHRGDAFFAARLRRSGRARGMW